MNGRTIIAGIDPGLTGAIVWVDARYKVMIDRAPLPVLFETRSRRVIDVLALRQLLERYPLDWVVLEHVHALPRDGRSSAFSFGRVLGAIETALTLTGCRYIKVAPQYWKKWASIPRGAPKTWSRGVLSRLCPSAFERVRSSDEADALLLALYALETRLLASQAAPTNPTMEQAS